MLLKKILLSSEIICVPETLSLPRIDYFDAFNPVVDDFLENNQIEIKEETPAKIKYTGLPMSYAPFEAGTIKFLEAISSCKNDEIFKDAIIQSVINIQWKYVYHFAVFHSLLLFANIAVFTLSLGFGIENIYILCTFSTINFILFVWEIVQMCTSSTWKEYFLDPYNYLDLIKFPIACGWMIFELFEIHSKYITAILAVLILVRGLSGFQIFDGTRFYINLIFRSLNSMKFFMIMLCYSTLTFSILFIISRNQALSFDSLWYSAWSLNFGSFSDPPENTIITLDYIFYIFATLINVVLMLNLLISILGDSYDEFQLNQYSIDYRQKLEHVLEIQKMIWWNKTSYESRKYLHLLTEAFEEDEIPDWNGRVLYMEQKNQKNFEKLQTSSEDNGKKILSVEDKILSVQANMERKIASVEDKISSVEEKIDINMQKILEILSSRS